MRRQRDGPFHSSQFSPLVFLPLCENFKKYELAENQSNLIVHKRKNGNIDFWAILSKHYHSSVLLHGCLLYLQRLQPLLCIKGKGGPFSWFYVATRYTIVHTTTYSASTLRVPHTQDVIFMQDLSGLDKKWSVSYSLDSLH